jgi:hypothetical protein
MCLRVNIPQVDPTVMDAPEVCPYEDCDGEYFTPISSTVRSLYATPHTIRSTRCGESVCDVGGRIGCIPRG